MKTREDALSLLHEFWHIVAARKNTDNEKFYEKFRAWYLNENYGLPNAGGINAGIFDGKNRTKFVIAWQLYGFDSNNKDWREMQKSGRYQNSADGVEESAYIWQEISDVSQLEQAQDRVLELSPELFSSFREFLNPEVIKIVENYKTKEGSLTQPVFQD